jgi:hypothetical protein
MTRPRRRREPRASRWDPSEPGLVVPGARRAADRQDFFADYGVSTVEKGFPTCHHSCKMGLHDAVALKTVPYKLHSRTS